MRSFRRQVELGLGAAGQSRSGISDYRRPEVRGGLQARGAQGPDGGESRVSFWRSTTASYGQVVERRMPEDDETRRGYGGSREAG